MTFLGPLRSGLFFLMELFFGRKIPRRTKRNTKTWKLIVFFLFVFSLGINVLTIRNVLNLLDENKDLKRRNYVVMTNNNELMELVTATRKVNDDFRDINMSLKQYNQVAIQTNNQLLELLKTKDIPLEKIEEIENSIEKAMIAQANILIKSKSVIEKETILEEKIDEGSTVTSN